MSRWPRAGVAAAIAAGGAALAMGIALLTLSPHDVAELAPALAVAVLLTLLVTVIAARRLDDSSIRARFSAVAILSTAIGLANLAVLARLMVISDDDAIRLGVLLVYAAIAAVGAALTMARTSTIAIERLSEAAGRLAEGDLSARVGPVEGGSELNALAEAFDEMAVRMTGSLERERAAEAQRRDLITAVSHDLRTPLAGIRAISEAIDDGVVSDRETIRRYMRAMRGSVESLVVMVDDLFELVQLDAGAIATETQRARLEDVVSSALSACDAQASEKGLVLRTRLGGSAGTPCSPRLERVVQNLLQNAIRHTPSDGSILVEASQCSDSLELAVEDSGEGIAGDQLDRVFEPFWRGEQARHSEGSGLGLALAKRIVESLGGRIEVSSEAAHGSRFLIALPLLASERV